MKSSSVILTNNCLRRVSLVCIVKWSFFKICFPAGEGKGKSTFFIVVSFCCDLFFFEFAATIFVSVIFLFLQPVLMVPLRQRVSLSRNILTCNHFILVNVIWPYYSIPPFKTNASSHVRNVTATRSDESRLFWQVAMFLHHCVFSLFSYRP